MADTIGRLWNGTDGINPFLRGHIDLDGVHYDVVIAPCLKPYEQQNPDAPDFLAIQPLFIRLWKLVSGKGSDFLKGHFGHVAVVIYKNPYGTSDWNITVDPDQRIHPRPRAPRPSYSSEARRPFGGSWYGPKPPPSPFQQPAAGPDFKPYEDTDWSTMPRSGPAPAHVFSNYEVSRFKEFGLDEPYTEERAKVVWRLGALKHHPDRGGSHEEFIAFKTLYQEVERILKL